jgi:hypothetical protein
MLTQSQHSKSCAHLQRGEALAAATDQRCEYGPHAAISSSLSAEDLQQLTHNVHERRVARLTGATKGAAAAAAAAAVSAQKILNSSLARYMNAGWRVCTCVWAKKRKGFQRIAVDIELSAKWSIPAAAIFSTGLL